MGKPTYLMEIFSSEREMSPVMERAVLLAARHGPFSWAARVKEMRRRDAVRALPRVFGMMRSLLPMLSLMYITEVAMRTLVDIPGE